MRLRFVLSEIGAGFRRNFSMVVAVILVTFVSLTAVGASLLLQTQINRVKGEWYGKVEVSVWLCMDNATDVSTCASGAVTQDQQKAIENILSSPQLKPYVEKVYTQSAAEVFQEFQQEQGGQSWAQGVTQDTFGPILQIKLFNPNNSAVIAQALGNQPGVYQVVDQHTLLDKLFKVLNKFQLAALLVAGVLMVAAVLLITTTIRLSAMSRRRETGIMRLVGASNFFIQLPFMLEGAVAAFIGSLFASGALWATVKYLAAGWINSVFGLTSGRIGPNDVLAIAPWLILVSVVLAGLSSALTLRRYTQV
jgi:cell division transport system permease protein